MSDYTPTTEEVRAEYVSYHLGYNEAEFDRWLAEHDREKQAQAWEEGKIAGWSGRAKTYQSTSTKPLKNPYRQGENK